MFAQKTFVLISDNAYSVGAKRLRNPAKRLRARFLLPPVVGMTWKAGFIENVTLSK